MRTRLLLVCLALTLPGLLSSGCDVTAPDVPQPATEVADPGWYTLYFTDPTAPTAGTYRGGPDQALADAIDQARLSVDAAIFDLNLWSIRDALLDAARRGVAVRVVTETDNLDEPEMQDLVEAGLQVVDDRLEGLMHNKFVVIDRSELWTGSMNFTTSDGYKNNNNLLRLRSSRLALSYTTEFVEMFEEKRFGAGAVSLPADQDMQVNGTRVEVYFSPEDGTADRLVELLQDAQESIYFLAFSFTSDELADVLIARAAQGVAVSGIFEQSQYNSNIGTDFDRMQEAGLAVLLDGNPRNMHHKVMIIDEQIVVTGSYNFSNSAENYNDENTLILHSPAIAQAYLQEFYAMVALAQK